MQCSGGLEIRGRLPVRGLWQGPGAGRPQPSAAVAPERRCVADRDGLRLQTVPGQLLEDVLDDCSDSDAVTVAQALIEAFKLHRLSPSIRNPHKDVHKQLKYPATTIQCATK